jgi:hypothetical protein
MTWRKAIALLLGLAGAVWFLQGIGVFTAIDSFMNYDGRWAIIGVLTVAVALALWNWTPRGE